MKIVINKDFEKEYKETVFLGLTLKELVTVSAAFVIESAMGFLAVIKWGIPFNASIYLGIPFALPFLAYGFYKKQDMDIVELFREYRSMKGQGTLSYESNEFIKRKGGR